MEEQQKNMFLAIALMVAILVGWNFLIAPHFERPAPKPPETVAGAPATTPTTQPAQPGNAPAPAAAGPATKPRAEVLGETPRIPIDTPRLHGSIALVGARLDDLTLASYHETIDPKSPEIVLLSPSGAPDPYFVQTGWNADTKTVPTPNADTRWTATTQGALSPSHPVELTWDNGHGLVFTRKISVDGNYMFTVTESVANHGSEGVTLSPYGLVSRAGSPPVSSSYLLHEGPIGVFDGTLNDGIKYTELKPDAKHDYPSTGGWLGFTDKYWLAVLIPDQQTHLTGQFRWTGDPQIQRYQADYVADGMTVPAGGSIETTTRVFAGAKEVTLLDSYESELGIPKFDRAIDFGWFYWITKPIFLTLDFFYQHIGNFGIAIMLLTLTIKLIFFPVANKSYRAMSKMKLLQPEIQKLREKYGEDKGKLNQEVMALYKRVGANPMMGCLPILIQMPVFFSLYKVLYVTIEMRQAPFYGWIHDLSVPDPTTWLNLFGLLPWHAPLALAFISLGAWPLIMGVTMFLQQKLNPPPADPVQAKMMMALPLVFTFMLGQFAAGLVIYWSWNNLLSIAQQWVIMRRAGAT
jgi:YidC/Oxa1 family membrane protein insertase